MEQLIGKNETTLNQITILNMSYSSPYTKKNTVGRYVWTIMWRIAVIPFPRKSGMWLKRTLIRLWGGQISESAIVYSSAKIFAPWNLVMHAHSCIGPDTDIYNAAMVILKDSAIVSQYSYLCTATHDIRSKDFNLYSLPITLEKLSWVSSKCFIGPGVTIGEGAVVGASASVYKDVPEWTVVGGNPAKEINKRVIRNE